MPYAIEFYLTNEESSKVTSKVYETLEELFASELGSGIDSADDYAIELLSEAGGSFSSGISYDRIGKIIEIDTDNGERFPEYDGRKVEALGGKLVFDYGYPPAFVINRVQ